MRNSSITALILVASWSLAFADSSTSRVGIVSPPDRFFAASNQLDVTIAASPRSGERMLSLRVDGSQREEYRLPAHATSVNHTFRIVVSPLDPPALIEVCLSQGVGADPGSCNSVRAAGP